MTTIGNITGETLRITIPASTSNLGPGFDAVGLALKLYLTLEVSRLDSGPCRIAYQGPEAHLVPADESNLIWRAMRLTAARAGATLPPFALEIRNEIPITKGLGSSAAASLGGVVAADFLCGLKLSAQQWLGLATELEGHPDNAAPSLWGGLVVSMSGETILCSRCEFPEDWTVVAVTPDFELETRLARAVLPEKVPHKHAVFNVQRASYLVAQLIQRRTEGLRDAMADHLHQPYRSALIPGLAEILAMKDREGLLGVALSGAGPTVIALADSHEMEIGRAMQDIFAHNGLSSRMRLLKADLHGLTLESLT